MARRRIDDYFPRIGVAIEATQVPRPKSLFDLPWSVRRRIYEDLGLFPTRDDKPWGPMMMNPGRITERSCQLGLEDYEAPFIWESEPPTCHRCLLQRIEPSSTRLSFRLRSRPPEGECECDRFPMELFLVCREMTQDVRRLFYSENSFEVVYTANGGFSTLENLSPEAVGALRNLSIRMNLCFCAKGPDCKMHSFGCHPACKEFGHDKPLGFRDGLGKRSRNDTRLLQSLRHLCHHLAAHLQPGRLRLTFVCECLDHDLAAELLSSLLPLPTLRSCSIALQKTFDARLREMAEQTRLRLLGYPESSITTPFPLRKLPRELQREVLHHTGLVAPQHLYYCSETNQPRFSLYGSDRTSVYDAESLNPAVLANSRLCCCRHHGSHSWPCACWRFPRELFLVDRQMEADARDIMYRENTWCLGWWEVFGAMEHLASYKDNPESSRPKWSETWSRSRLPARVKLRQFPRFFKSARRIQLEFSFGSNAVADHLMQFQNLFSMCNTTRLQLTLRLPHPSFPHPALPADMTAPIWLSHYHTVLCIAKAALAAGNGDGAPKFRDFFVWIDSIRCHRRENEAGVTVRDCQGLGEHGMRQREQVLERIVMGEGYDSQSRGKQGKMHVPTRELPPEAQGALMCSDCSLIEDFQERE